MENGMNMFFGIVEAVDDPLELGRVKARVFGIHNISKQILPTSDLPWYSVMLPTNSASFGGVGCTPDLIIGSRVVLFFIDGSAMQEALIIGTIPTIEQSEIVRINGQNAGVESEVDSESVGQSSLPPLSRSGRTTVLRDSVQVNGIPGSFNEPSDLRPFRRYPYSNVRTTRSGHIEEWDDTPGNERIGVQHKSGTYTEMRPDGDNVTKVVKDNYTIVAGDNNLYVRGNVNILVEGDVNFTTEGDFNLNVGGDYNVRVQGDEFKHVNKDKTEIVNQNENSYIVGSKDETIGASRTSTIVGSDTTSVYTDSTHNTYGNSVRTVLGSSADNVSGDITLSSKGNVDVHSDRFDANTNTASFTDLSTDSKIEVYSQDFESIEADVTVNSADVELMSTQVGAVSRESYVEGTTNISYIEPDGTGTGNRVATGNGTNTSTASATAPVFISGNRVESNYSNVVYNYASNTKRDGKVDSSLEAILSTAAKAAGVYQIEIYSGRQPGSTGRRTGSGRHDTGFAADIRLIKSVEDLNNETGIIYVGSNTTEGQSIISNFMKYAVANGIKGAGHSSYYMGYYGIHVDTLGQIINTSNSTSPSAYDRNILAAWKSVDWFRQAMLSGDSTYQYYIALASGTRYYSKTNTSWNRLA